MTEFQAEQIGNDNSADITQDARFFDSDGSKLAFGIEATGVVLFGIGAAEVPPEYAPFMMLGVLACATPIASNLGSFVRRRWPPLDRQ
ncbi:MAG TPA: hypothetical protein VIH90_08510 [Candidatus Saccharimonadales bacterium]